jgi:AcrR family transcriptional regulator
MPEDADAQDLPQPPWQRVPPRRQRRRREPLTREAIVAVALEILDIPGEGGGLASLTMRRVADELETGVGALYRHIGSKDGLLDLLFDHVIGEIADEIPDADPDHWRQQLKDVARAMRSGILRHRDIVLISIGRIPLGPNALRFSDRTLAILRAGQVPDQLAVLAHHLLIAAVNGFTLDESDGPAPPANQPPPEQAAAQSRDYLAALPAERFPNLVPVAEHFAISDADQRFNLLLDLFVDGLAQRAPAS